MIVTIIHQNVTVSKDSAIEIEMLATINIVQDVMPLDHQFHLAIQVAVNDAIHIAQTHHQNLDPIPLSVTQEVQVVPDTIQVPGTVDHVRQYLR